MIQLEPYTLCQTLATEDITLNFPEHNQFRISRKDISTNFCAQTLAERNLGLHNYLVCFSMWQMAFLDIPKVRPCVIWEVSCLYVYYFLHSCRRNGDTGDVWCRLVGSCARQARTDSSHQSRHVDFRALWGKWFSPVQRVFLPQKLGSLCSAELDPQVSCPKLMRMKKFQPLLCSVIYLKFTKGSSKQSRELDVLGTSASHFNHRILGDFHPKLPEV